MNIDDYKYTISETDDGEEFIPYRCLNNVMQEEWTPYQWNQLHIDQQKAEIRDHCKYTHERKHGKPGRPRKGEQRRSKKKFVRIGGLKVERPKEKPLVPYKRLPLTHAFDYNPETGELWRTGARGMNCEHLNGGYKTVTWGGGRIISHRLIWLLMRGEWAREPIVHINRDKLDNRWCNLRLMGAKKKLKAQVRHHGIVVSLGYVSTPEDRDARIAHYRGLRELGVDHVSAVHSAKQLDPK